RRVAHAQERGGCDRRRRGGKTAGTDDTDEGELRPTSEHEQAQHTGLPDVEAGRHREGAERHAVRTRGERHAQCGACGSAPSLICSVCRTHAHYSERRREGSQSERVFAIMNTWTTSA